MLMTETPKRKASAQSTLWLKRALHEYCFLQAHGDYPGALEQLRQQLGDWTPHRVLFVVRYLYKPSQLATARKLRNRREALDTYVNWHRRAVALKEHAFPDGSRFQQYLARAYVLTVDMQVPAAEWERLEDLAAEVAKYVTARRLLHSGGEDDQQWNREQVINSPAASLLDMNDDPELVRCEQLAYRRVYSVLASGMPPRRVVADLLDTHEAEQYRERVEEMEEASEVMTAYCGPSLHDALEQGKAKHWTAEKVTSRLALFGVLYEAYMNNTDGVPPAMRIAELLSSGRSGGERKPVSAARAEAHQYGFWRIYSSEQSQWQQAMSADEWRRYSEAMAQVPRGVFMHVRRRWFTADSLAHMRTTNLAAMEARFPPPSSSSSSQ